MLSNTFFIADKLNCIAIDYRQDLFKFKNYHFTKYFTKLEAVACVCVCVLEGEKPTGIILVFPFEILQSKGKGKMK